MRFRVGTHFDYYTLTSLKEMKHRVKVLIALSLLCCGLKLQAQEHIDYYNVDFSEGIPTEMLTYDLDGHLSPRMSPLLTLGITQNDNLGMVLPVFQIGIRLLS